jgi:hypothetical protein
MNLQMTDYQLITTLNYLLQQFPLWDFTGEFIRLIRPS